MVGLTTKKLDGNPAASPLSEKVFCNAVAKRNRIGEVGIQLAQSSGVSELSYTRVGCGTVRICI